MCLRGLASTGFAGTAATPAMVVVSVIVVIVVAPCAVVTEGACLISSLHDDVIKGGRRARFVRGRPEDSAGRISSDDPAPILGVPEWRPVAEADVVSLGPGLPVSTEQRDIVPSGERCPGRRLWVNQVLFWDTSHFPLPFSRPRRRRRRCRRRRHRLCERSAPRRPTGLCT